MSGNSLVDGATQLQEAAELLERVWRATEDHWNDVVRERFEAEQLVPLRKQIADARSAIQQLGDLLNAAKRHASDVDRHGD